jgi:hypothetical protein
MIESWMLADAGAYFEVYHREPNHPRLPRRPEMIWGIEGDYNTDHPKNVMELVLRQFFEEPNRDIYVSIAANAHIDILRERCPTSFARFMDDIIEADNRINQ